MQEQPEVEHSPQQIDQTPLKKMHPISSLLHFLLHLNQMRADPQRILQDNELGNLAKRPQEEKAPKTDLRDEQ